MSELENVKLIWPIWPIHLLADYFENLVITHHVIAEGKKLFETGFWNVFEVFDYIDKAYNFHFKEKSKYMLCINLISYPKILTSLF